MHHLNLYIVPREFLKRVGERLYRTLHIGLDDEIQRLSLTLTHLLKHILKFHRLLTREFDLFKSTLAMLCNLAGSSFSGHHNGVIARIRYAAQPLDFHWTRRRRLLNHTPCTIGHGPNLAEFATSEQDIAFP